jgi:hypothetical protein
MSVGLLRPEWPVHERVRAAMSLRDGGVSVAPFASLNLGDHVGDAPEAVAQNRARLRAALALPTEPLWLRQVHGAHVHRDEESDAAEPSTAPLADAAVARRAGAVLAILVADCLPVLLADRRGDVIGAAHAGWRGLAAGVLEATVAAMAAPAATLSAWLGPAITQPHFEVGEEVRAVFVAHDPAADECFVRNARGRWQCDLPALARARLQGLGVSSIVDSGLCTVADAQHCYSYRRDGRTGRMAALLWLQP